MQQELMDKYVESLPERSKRELGAIARSYLQFLKDKKPNRQSVEDYLYSLREGDEPYAAGTIHKRYDVIRRLFIVNELEWPFRRHEAPIISERDVWAPSLDPDVIRAMVDVCLGRAPSKATMPRRDHRAYLLISTIWGLRRVEMMELSPNSLDFKNKLIFVQTAKRGRQRYHIIPDAAIPFLEDWEFSERKSSNGLTIMFRELEAMVGLEVYDIGWHAIRRSLARQLRRLGFDEAAIYTFLRWKRSTWDMSMRYATAPVVGFEGADKELSTSDSQVDQAILANHPFLSYWEDSSSITAS
jgi:integrase